MTWKTDLSALISARWRPGQTFTLNQVYEFEDRLAVLHPANYHVQDKIRQTLQYLRNEGELSFIDERGAYLRLK